MYTSLLLTYGQLKIVKKYLPVRRCERDQIEDQCLSESSEYILAEKNDDTSLLLIC